MRQRIDVDRSSLIRPVLNIGAAIAVSLVLSWAIVSPVLLRAQSPLPLLAPTPYMGWNTWYGLGATFNEAAITATVDQLVRSGLKDAGYTYIWLDAGWWPGTRDSTGTITVSTAQWPHGMAYIAQYIHNAGLKAGIYTDAGHGGCAGFGQGSAGYYQQDMNTFAAWGYDAVKVDWCGASSDRLDPKPTFAALRDALLNNSSGRQMLLHLCSWSLNNDSWEFGPYTGHSWRTHGDIAGIGSATWYSILGNFDANSAHPGSNGPNHWNDPDYLQVHIEGVSDTEAQAQFSLWALMAAPLIIGADIRTLTAAQVDMLTNREVIAIDQDPLGIQAIKVADPGYRLQIWSKVLSVPGQRAVALFNRNDTPSNITLVNSELGLSGSFAVRDVWTHTDRGQFSSYTATVPAHGAVLLKLTGAIENNLRSMAINAGGPAEPPFVADTNSVDGRTLSVADPIALATAANPAPAAVYQSARLGREGTPLQYYIGNLTVGGEYRVRLHFAEHWLNAPGLRQFNVRINGSEVLHDFDVYAAAGYRPHAAVVQEFTTTATQGFVSVDLSKGAASDPMIAGIEVISTSSPSPATAPRANLALHATAYASSQWDANYSSFGAIDGDTTTTRWNAAAGAAIGEWLEIDFGGATTFDQTTIREALNRITGYTLQYHNGSIWVDLISARTIGSSKTDTFPAVTASRLRLYVTSAVSNGGGASPSIYEFEVFNTSSGPGGGPLPPQPPAPNILPTGAVDEVRSSDHVVAGWSYDPDSTAASVSVRVYIDGPVNVGTAIAALPASVSRPDVNAAYGISGNHGFEVAIPDAYADGINHRVYVYAVDVNDPAATTLLSGSPKPFVFTKPVPLPPGPGTSPSTSASFVALDSITHGSWKGLYGMDGNQIANESAALPSYASTAFRNYGAYTWSDYTGDTRALQKTAATERIASVWFNSGFSFTLNIKDGQTHQVSLYFLDWDNLGRSELVEVRDASSGAVLLSRSLSSFQSGLYLTLNISGTVVFDFTGTNGSQAVLSGLFFGGALPSTPLPPIPPSPVSGAASAVFVGTDAATGGNWKATYGAGGYRSPLETASWPADAALVLEGKSDYTWNPDTLDVRGLQYLNRQNRFAATWYSPTAFAVRMSFVDGQPHQVALYALDWDNLGRAETIRVNDADTGALLDTRSVGSFGAGKYCIWTVTGKVVFSISRDIGPNAVLSAIFVGPP
jgi:hypothetical protein